MVTETYQQAIGQGHLSSRSNHAPDQPSHFLVFAAQPQRVKGVAMDMHEPFRQAVRMSLPQAKVVVDKFHLIRHVNDVLDKTRSRLQGEIGRDKKRDLCRSREAYGLGESEITQAILPLP